MTKSAICAQNKWQVLMPILVCVHHLHQDLLYVLVNGFHYTIRLRAIGDRISVLDLELLAELLDHFSI